MEYFDLYDENKRPLGRKQLRGLKIPEGCYKTAVSIYVMNSKNELFCTLRDSAKNFLPGKWEVTCGGVQAGETSVQGAVRELKEETGITASENEMVFLESVLFEQTFFDSFFVHKDIHINSITLLPGETCDAQWFSLEQVHKMMEENLFTPAGTEHFYSLEKRLITENRKYL